MSLSRVDRFCYAHLTMPTTPNAIATFGSGCFWCSEALFKDLRGVVSVISGYAGGRTPAPTYEQVCSGTTGHAEVIQITYDPSVITYEQLVEVFFLTHDPTTLNRQGNDIGEQYRSVIFTQDETQRATAERVKARIETDQVYDRPIVTQILPAGPFYQAEKYHQDYYANNPDQGYCQMIIDPKVAKFRKRFANLLRPAKPTD